MKKLIVAQLVKEFPAFYGTRMFITVFTKSWAPRLVLIFVYPDNYQTSQGFPAKIFCILPLRVTRPSHPVKLSEFLFVLHCSQYLQNFNERHSRVVNNPASCSGGPGFES
jgi:hypothetical protein